MDSLLRFWRVGVGALVGIGLAYQLGHWIGFRAGRDYEVTQQAAHAAVEIGHTAQQRDEVDDKVRKLPDSAIDSELRRSGWLRD